MTSLDRLKPVLRSPLLPLALLLLALSTVFVFGGDRGYFYRGDSHNAISSHHLVVAVNISPEHGFQRFTRRTIDDDGVTRYRPYNRFPVGSYLIIKLATLPFGWSPSDQLYAVRIFMLMFFSTAAVLAYLALFRLASNRWIALTATLLAFSSYYLLYFNDVTGNESMIDLFGVMLTFHGMVVFVQEGRLRQLLVKTCIALLLGWHVFAILLPFIVIGLASDLLRARSAAPSPHPPTLLQRGKQAASVLLRSRYLVLGIVALACGLSVLTFNFAMEYAALNGEAPLTELPSFQSMLRRTGADPDYNEITAPYRAWSPFLEGQFQSVVRTFIPYSLLGSLGYRGAPGQSPTWLTEFQSVIVGVILSAACLIASMFVRPRILFVTLASFGFFWSVPMRNATALHDYEPIYYVGLPLVFFTIVLLLARRLISRDVVIPAASAIALLLFVVSSFQMGRIGYTEDDAQIARAAEHDLLSMREATEDELVTVLHIGGSHKSFFGYARHAVEYYLNTSLIRYEHLPAVEGGFVVMRERIDTDALLTPQNQYLFFYDRAGLEAWYATAYRTIASREPAERSKFDLYIDDGKVYYLKEPCEREDAAGRLFLHVYPFDVGDLPDHRRQRGFEILDFYFVERGLLFDGKCLVSVDLPQYDIVKINTGRVDGDAWNATHVVQGPKLDSAYRTVVSLEPAARSEFDLYIDGGKLHYVKEPCGEEDTGERFFLHVVPENIDDLPNDRRQHGFDNLDFAFIERGLLFDGKCLVSVDLPQYGAARITTGQFDGDGRIWEVEFTPNE